MSRLIQNEPNQGDTRLILEQDDAFRNEAEMFACIGISRNTNRLSPARGLGNLVNCCRAYTPQNLLLLRI